MNNMSQLGQMFTYIALRHLQFATNPKKYKLLHISELKGAATLVAELGKRGVVHINMDGSIRINRKGGKLVDRYFAVCADMLHAGHFGNFTWSKRSKFHKALMQRIA